MNNEPGGKGGLEFGREIDVVVLMSGGNFEASDPILRRKIDLNIWSVSSRLIF